MKRLFNFVLLTFVLSVFVFPLHIKAEQVTVQPKIMVVPFVKEGEDIRTVLEEDADKRIVLTKVKEAFDSRGFTTVDFLGKLKATSVQSGMSDEHQSDLKSMIIASSGADIYVDTEMVINRSSSGNAVKVIITAYDISTGSSLSNKVGDSGKFYTEDFGRLGSKAIESCAEDFLNIMQSKFNDIVANGRSINMTIGFDDASSLNMNSEVSNDGLTLADLIEMWLEDNAFQGNFHVQGTTATRMIVDDVKLPLKDANGRNYSVANFGRDFLRFAQKNNLKIKRDVVGNSLIITIL
ncbi:MAG: hypothetical protein K2G90_02850 [Muribaculaceae bacterium]|nr:hypothetical protein [Muribaculaceae bacterium]MDE6008125.1 hypothetical protein [Muribaculaceae bacterium]